MKMLSAEEKNDYYYWFVLDKIKEEIYLKNNKDSLITYSLYFIPSLNDPHKPNPTTEQKVIDRLIEGKVIKEVDAQTDFQIGGDGIGNPKSAGVHYYLEIDDSRFDHLYKEYKSRVEQYETAEEDGNTLYFNESGEIKYISPEGKTYTTKLNTSANSFQLLRFLANQPSQKFGFSDLAEHLNSPRAQDKGSTDERRVRDTISSIKKALKYRGEDLFIAEWGFGIKCKVHIIK